MPGVSLELPSPELATAEVGSRHVLAGLKSRPHLNGEAVQVTGYLPDGKLKVVLIGSLGGKKEYAVSPENLASADAERRAANGDRSSGVESAPVNPLDVSPFHPQPSRLTRPLLGSLAGRTSLAGWPCELTGGVNE